MNAFVRFHNKQLRSLLEREREELWSQIVTTTQSSSSIEAAHPRAKDRFEGGKI